jgi:hypothetical protein
MAPLLLNGSIRWALSATNDYSYYYSPTSDGVKAEDGRTPPSSGLIYWAQGQGKSSPRSGSSFPAALSIAQV